MSDNRRLIECPNCGHGESLWSDEQASIMYPIKLYRDGNGGADVEYTGDAYEPCDEGTEYVGDIWCRSCSTQYTEADLGVEDPTVTVAALPLWIELLAVHASSNQHPTLERRQMARSYRNGMVAVYARVTGQAEETVMEALDAASVEQHEKETAS